MGKTTSSHQQQAVNFAFLAFSVLVVGISAITSFSFFFTYFSALIPDGVLDTFIRQLISGVVGVLLLDLAAVIWLMTFLHHSETSEQRAISLSMTIVTFFGAAMASIAYLSLTATGEMQLSASSKETIGIVALVTVIAAIVLNFGAAQAHSRFSLSSKHAVREADRRDAIQQAEDEQADYLDKLVTQSVKEKLTAMAPQLAESQAGRLAKKFYDHEQTKYIRKTQGVTFAQEVPQVDMELLPIENFPEETKSPKGESR